jgi:hypothetical protein
MLIKRIFTHEAQFIFIYLQSLPSRFDLNNACFDFYFMKTSLKFITNTFLFL